MANPEHVELVRQGTEAIAAWREANPEERLDLSRAYLYEIKLSGFNLRNANLRDARLGKSNLSISDLSGCDLSDAYLGDAYLTNATLRGADLSRTNLHNGELSGADLTNANLTNANLTNANLTGADLSSADLSRADLSSVDLTPTRINLDTKFDNIFLNGETKGLPQWVRNPEKYIIREIEFPPEYKQAGIGIMNYFAEVMRQKYPDIPATVQITQEDLTVRMTIETDDGHRETVERTLEEYGLVVAGHRQPDTLVTNQADVIRLETQLSVARVQLETEQKLRLLGEKQYEQRIESLEDRVSQLLNLVGDSLQNSHQALQREQAHANRLVDVLELQALAPLRELLARGLTEADETEAKRALAEAENISPGTLQRLAEGISSGALGGVISANAPRLIKWVQEVADHVGIALRLIN